MVRRSSNGVLLTWWLYVALQDCLSNCVKLYVAIVMCSRIGRVHQDWYGEERAQWGVVIAGMVYSCMSIAVIAMYSLSH